MRILLLKTEECLWKKCLKVNLQENKIMATIKIKQVRSRINSPIDQKRTLDALGLRKLNRVVEHPDNPAIRGMIEKVKHLVSIVE
ncbi:50S ribosomal protein L30 [Dysgonomonas sp. HDW5A]|nr:50S ribosomal protein L30 [Dysgonomonas sp. HDW5B]QIK60044.1 50S ribosomal protein L30 [Dysgonomonas sp. HDW5A]